MRDMLCPRLPKSGVNPYTLYPYTPVYPSRALSPIEVPRGALGGPHEEEGTRRPYLCLLPCLILSPVLRTPKYVAKGGRRRPGQISRLATPPGSQVGPCRPALKSAPWGGKLSRPQPRRSGPRPDVDGAVPPDKLHRPPRGGANAVRSVRSQWCGATVGCRHAPHAASRPPTFPPAHPPTATALPQRMGMPMAVPVPVGWGGVCWCARVLDPPGLGDGGWRKSQLAEPRFSGRFRGSPGDQAGTLSAAPGCPWAPWGWEPRAVGPGPHCVLRDAAHVGTHGDSSPPRTSPPRRAFGLRPKAPQFCPCGALGSVRHGFPPSA